MPDPKSAKRRLWFDCLFALLGARHVKSARKMILMKLTPVVEMALSTNGEKKMSFTTFLADHANDLNSLDVCVCLIEGMKLR